jgi:D-serine deaminase-like pyridoxal phosphate-dependent protein
MEMAQDTAASAETRRALEALPTPCLLLDEERMDRNAARVAAQVARLGVPLRLHVKTAKSIEVVRQVAGPPPAPLTVSTLEEAEHCAAAGYRDLLYAVGIVPNKLDRVLAMRRDGIALTVILDSIEAARAVAGASAAAGDAIPALIEIDCDGQRAGIAPEHGERIRAVAATLAAGGRVAGAMTHCGGSYGARSADELRAWARRERDAAVAAGDTLRAAGHAIDTVSVGSTPTILHAEDLTGVTEARAGVHVFMDLVMAGIGVCAIDDIAISVLGSVIAAQPERGRYLVDAGWMALSRDRGTASQPVDQGYGLVCDRDGRRYGDLIVTEVNQEHGVIAPRAGGSTGLPALAVGDLVRILPNHACATAAQHDRYHVLAADGGAIACWCRFGGW